MCAYFSNDVSISAGTTAGISDGAIYIFSSELSKEQKRDVSESTLLAHLAADRQFDRIEAPELWYDSYTYTLQKVGWITSGNFDFAPYSNSVSASQFVVDSLKSKLEFASMRDVTKAVDTVKKMSDGNNALKIFTEGSSSGGDTSFQIGHCHSSGNDVVIGLGAFAYHMDKHVLKNPLVPMLKGTSANAKFAYTTMTLNAGVYNMVRQAVRNKLGSNASRIVEITT